MLMAAAINQAAAVTTTCAGNSLALRAIFRRGKNHSSKDKGNHAGENQQQDSDVYPSGLGHLNLVLFPRIGSQFNSIERM